MKHLSLSELQKYCLIRAPVSTTVGTEMRADLPVGVGQAQFGLDGILDVNKCALLHHMLPRATVMASPLTPLDSSDARKAITSATSSGVTTRPTG